MENKITTTKQCSTCDKVYSIDCFVGLKNQETKTCINCREKNKIQDAKRDKQHRNAIARKNEAKPERIEVKKRWNEANYEKVALKWINYRQRKMEKLGIEEYLKQNAEQAKKWRENNPEKVKEIYENKKLSMPNQYETYKRSANDRNLIFHINYENYVNIVENSCYYCNEIQERGFNGIDRINSTIGYEIENCVSCCQMCNYLKGSLSDNAFICRAEHILTNQKLIDGILYPQYFTNHNKTTYNSYKNRAIRKNIEFFISEEDYEYITSLTCYLCGKESNTTHSNGIDRINNELGYINDNVAGCCGECNYMKKNYQYDEFIEKLINIYNNCQNKLKNENINENNDKIMVKGNKKSKEEKQEIFEKRKIEKQNILLNKYNDEKYKMKRANELAENRQNMYTHEE
jgi:hypothetical protein